jgi:3-oxoacyl-[acyl-carrier protein] reductase
MPSPKHKDSGVEKGEGYMDRFSGKIAMVTGGATGLGAAIVERLAMDGARVACCYNKSHAGAEALAARLEARGRHILLTQVDVTDSRQVQAGVEAIAAHFGKPINILVNNAGDNINPTPLDQMEEATWDLVIAINLRGIFLCSKYCVPAMKAAGWGRIINVSSISARTGGGPGSAHYVASKGGVDALTRSMAKELAAYNVTVNGIAPGVIYTPLHERTNTPESLEKLRQTIPLGRLGQPEDVAGVVAFLATDDAAYITGEIIAINGGLRMD